MRSIAAAGCMLLLATALQAQECELVHSTTLNTVGGGAVTYFGGGVTFACPNNVRINADSAIFVRDTDRFDFMGNVRYFDETRSLTAQQAQYARSERKVMAQINVVVTNREDGSTLRANALDYYQPSDVNPDGRVDVHPGGRPRGTLIRRRENTAVMDTTIIDADRMQLIGERIFRGWGNVQTRRGTMTSSSQYAEFDEETSRMRLTGQAVVQSDTFRLRADSIEAVLVDGDEFRELHAHRNVIVESEEVDLNAPAVHLTFTEGQVERLIAVGGAKTVFENAPQARAVSPDFVLTADSIDALSPEQKLETVIAIGKAHGERMDTTANRDLPQLIQNDWVRGDTIRAWFTDRDTVTPPRPGARPTPVVGGDSTRVLERILATGNPASSTYRLREQSGDTVSISVNYITAKKLDVTFTQGEVAKVEAAGNIRGLYLQPAQRAQAATAPGRRE
jgi:lipopolysaccharide export system protein LptA